MFLKGSQFTKQDVEVEQSSLRFQGFFRMLEFRFRHKLFNGGWSVPIQRELLERGDAAAAIVYDAVQDKIALVEQIRVGALNSEHGPWCLEVVAGMIEKDELPEALIRRELEEEAGICEAELIFISRYYSTPGGCSEQIHLYCALCDLSDAQGVYGLESEGEDIRLHVFDAESVFASMYQSRTNNAATLIGLQWLQLNRASLRENAL